ncbi:unnamed protein product, partial [Meganyctiphanes norvegica]
MPINFLYECTLRCVCMDITSSFLTALQNIIKQSNIKGYRVVLKEGSVTLFITINPVFCKRLLKEIHILTKVVSGHQEIFSCIKAPPGHGIVLEVVRMRLRRSSKCADTSLQVRSAMGKSSYRPLARFCGKGPSSKFWKTPFPMVDLVYFSNSTKTKTLKRNKSKYSQAVAATRSKEGRKYSQVVAATRRKEGRKYNQAVAATRSKEARRQRVQMLQRFYDNRRKPQYIQKALKVTVKPPANRNHYQYKPSHSDSDSRRYYRDSNLTRDEALFNKDMRFDNQSQGVDHDQYVYDDETDIYAIVSHYSDNTSLRFLNVGDPTWISNSFIIDGLHLNQTYPHETDDSLKKRGKKKKKNSKSSKKNKKSNKKKKDPLEINAVNTDNAANTDNDKQTLLNEGEEFERVVRSVQRQARQSSRGRRRSRYHRTRYYTVERSRPTNDNKQYRVTISRHRNTNKPLSEIMPQQKEVPRTRYHSSPRREYVTNDIIEKPSKYNGYPPYSSSKNFGYKNSKEEQLGKDISKWRPSRKRKEFFFFQARAYKGQCGGIETAQKGSITSLHYPEKSRGKTSCFWKIETKASSRWKLRCPEFRLRKSTECKRDHLAIRINDGQWTRYCGREGPSVALTSSHEASVEVVLNTYSKHPVKIQCTWTTHNNDRSSGRYSYNYWSYNLTRVTTPPPPTTTTTQKPIVNHTQSSCQAYAQLSPNHTMCKPSPPTCSMYQVGLSSEEQHLILDSHNKYRAIVARGEETEGLPGPQYSASNMRQLVWNNELAQVAQAWATTCPDYHDCHDCRKIISRKYYVGQNIFYEWSSSNPGSVWETAVRLWYEEVKYVPNYLTKSFSITVLGKFELILWANFHHSSFGREFHNCEAELPERLWKSKSKFCKTPPSSFYSKRKTY